MGAGLKVSKVLFAAVQTVKDEHWRTLPPFGAGGDVHGQQQERDADAVAGEALAEIQLHLTTALARARLTKTQLAAQAGLGRTTVQQAFRGSAAPSPETIVALCKVLRLDDSDLLELQRAASEPTERMATTDGLGRPIRSWHPHQLEVHPAGEIPSPASSGDPWQGLPGYVYREHDMILAGAVERASRGHSSLLMLVGTSSTGKTRSCWEAIQPLAQLDWKLWHPFDPTRADAALRDLQRVRQRTVLWLNEAQHYFGHPVHGERIAASVHRLLIESDRAPVLVLGTLWPEYADQYLRLPMTAGEDPYSRVRELLAGRVVAVPEHFDETALKAAGHLASKGDRLLGDALDRSCKTGKVTQELAGAPELLRRYANATPAPRALLHAAMDARRLGVGLHLPKDFLTEAAFDYLSDEEYDDLDDGWEGNAFDDLARPVHGKRSPLRSTIGRQERHQSHPLPPSLRATTSERTLFRLADYLEQWGRKSRRTICPPNSFWVAAHAYLRDADDLYRLASEALSRHRTQWAHHLRVRAAELGNARAQADLSEQLEIEGFYAEAELWARKAAALGSTYGLSTLCRMREVRKDHASADNLALLAAQAGDISAALDLVRSRERDESPIDAEPMAIRLAEAGYVRALSTLAESREWASKSKSAAKLHFAAARAGDPHSLIWIGHVYKVNDRLKEAEIYYRKAAAAGNDYALVCLLVMAKLEEDAEKIAAILREVSRTKEASTLVALIQWHEAEGHKRQAEECARRAAKLGHHRLLADVGRTREGDGDFETAEALYREAFAAGDPEGLADVVKLKVACEDFTGAEETAMLCAENGNGDPLCRLVNFWCHVGDRDRAEALVYRAAGSGFYDAYVELAWQHQQAGDLESAKALYEKAAGADHADALSELAAIHEKAGNHQQAESLAALAADAGRGDAIGHLVVAREESGSFDRATELARRAAASGHPEVLLELAELREEAGSSVDVEYLYREAADAACPMDPVLKAIWPHGLNPDGSPTQPWSARTGAQADGWA